MFQLCLPHSRLYSRSPFLFHVRGRAGYLNHAVGGEQAGSRTVARKSSQQRQGGLATANPLKARRERVAEPRLSTHPPPCWAPYPPSDVRSIQTRRHEGRTADRFRALCVIRGSTSFGSSGLVTQGDIERPPGLVVKVSGLIVRVEQVGNPTLEPHGFAQPVLGAQVQ